MRLSDCSNNCMAVFTMFRETVAHLDKKLPKNTTRLGAGEDWKHKEARR